MPSPEIMNVPVIRTTDIPEKARDIVPHKRLLFEKYLRPLLLLVAIYSLIINRALENKKVTEQEELSAPGQIVDDYTKSYTHVSKPGKQEALPLVFYTGMSIVLYPTYLLWK